MLQLFQTPEGDVATKKWSQNMLTKQRAIFWDHFGVSDLIIDKVRPNCPMQLNLLALWTGLFESRLTLTQG